MNLRKFEKLCKEQKNITVYSQLEAGQQWVSNGVCFYKIKGLPELTEESIPLIFNIRDTQNWLIDCAGDGEDKDIAHTREGEQLLNATKVHITLDGEELLPMISEDKKTVVFIREKLLSPVDDETEQREDYLRESGQHKYVAVKSGLLLVGLVLPKEKMPEKYREEMLLLAGLLA